MMLNENIKINRPMDQLGLPPMELAESSNDRSPKCVDRCIYPALQKVLILLILITFSVGIYVLLLKLLDSTESNRNTEIILVTGLKNTPNITVHQGDMDIFFSIKNFTNIDNLKLKRKKRDAFVPSHRHKDLSHLTVSDFNKVRDIVLSHRRLCHDNKHKTKCTELIAKFQSILKQDQAQQRGEEKVEQKVGNKGLSKDIEVHVVPSEVGKREAHPLTKLKGITEAHPVPIERHLGHGVPHPHPPLPPHLTDTCLLAKLLKQSYPHVQEIYDPQTSEYITSHAAHSHRPHMRFYQPDGTYLTSRESENDKRKLHPQDLDIFMSFFTLRPDLLEKPDFNTSIRATDCPTGSLPCDSTGTCLEENLWCDGHVDCSDASDELNCGCKARVDKSRLCDGYFDCPYGEDEMGCFGCSSNMFSCEDLHVSSRSTCYTKEQRCNNVLDCPNHKDELECNMLAPGLLKKPLFSVSSTEGFLHRNFKGEWYAVCQNPYMWAHDACRRETGLMIRPPFIQVVPVDPMLKVNYLNAGPTGLIHSSDTCFNSSAIYVTCPDFLCGTRAQSTAQLLRENMALENELFGRNKRYLFPPAHSFDPYNVFYGRRMKREITNVDAKAMNEKSHKVNEPISQINDERNKRAEGRVVGGKPSQPAAWPWMVAIYRNGMFHCGGVIFSQSWVISAAHCVHKFWEHYYEVQVGMLRRFSFSPQEQNHRITHIIVNQHYSQVDMKDDLSLLKVDPAIQFSRWVRPICLPGPNTAGHDWLWGPAPGTICTAVGWGATEEHGPDPDHMREVEVPIWERCKHREDRAGKEICAGLKEGGKDACQGDSGGPLLCRNPLNSQQWYLTGIVSHGDGCARKDEPGVYTRVSLFVKWIRYHTSSPSLPLLRPLQECPGFKCKTGISKCLPFSRKCDKIIDCLHGEDETNCNFMRSNDLPSVTSNENESSKSSEIFLREVQPTNSTLTVVNAVASSTESIPSSNLSIKHNIKPNDEISTEPKVNQSTTSSGPDFAHASTVEVSAPSSSEEFKTDDEHVTSDPFEPFHEDVPSISMAFEPETLESRSSVARKEMDENKENSDLKAAEGEDNLKLGTNNTNSTPLPIQSSTTKLFSENVTERDDKTILDIEKTTIDSQNISVVTTDNIMNNTSDELKNNFKQDKIKTEETKIVPIGQNITNTDTNLQSGNVENRGDLLSMDLMPKTDLIPIDNQSEQSEPIPSKIEKNEPNSEPVSESKILPDAEDKINVAQNIDDIVFSELQPASIRRKHLVPKEFQCRRIDQMIAYSERCDHKADCEDGTDELDCDCSDYLAAYDQKLICDGVFDCADGQDELECYTCPEEYFLCKRSEICVPNKYICDGKPHCPLGEDEHNCFALSNGREMYYELDDKPKVNLEGFLTKRTKDSWQVLCENKLTIEQQEQSAMHICHYLGFSSANRYYIKHINVKDEDIGSGLDEIKRIKRATARSVTVHFNFREVRESSARDIVIKEPQVLKEECVPNITKTCESLYVYCDRSLYTNFENFDVSQNVLYAKEAEVKKEVSSQMWPWIAKVYVEGHYKCTGILVDLSWVIVSDTCLWDTSPTRNFIAVVLGSHRTLNSVNGLYERVHKVNAKKDLYRNRLVLLHLKEPAEYSNMVKPMIISPPIFHSDQKTICVAVGQDNSNNTITVFLNETNKNCNLSNRCFVRQGKEQICSAAIKPPRQWSGIISCHNEQGWYPAASFVDSRGECGLEDLIVGTGIENLKSEIKYYTGKLQTSNSLEHADSESCDGVRCSRGRCLSLKHMCDGVRHCEDGNDESEESCKIKRVVCDEDPYHRGCECSLGHMKCRNGKCVPKELFRDGNDDCGDGTDEPMRSSCSDYLARVMPSRLCDGVLHCKDRSDEEPMFCKCFAKRTYKCGKASDADHCVAPDMVCDGVRDCPNGDDERTCMGLTAPEGTPYGTGQVLVRSHGVWHSKCYPSPTHTKSELEAICRELGFISGHAKEIKDVEKYLVNSHNNYLLEPYSDVILNNQTVIKMRNTNNPIARAVFDDELKNCYPVIVECL